ncbi:BNR-4 repeat-containing protein, partial [Schnuerera sp.]|uniref:BNR-4 repeat-containing protein n=1 Tax=Schnuerera sp. TaxID=2794844 RepID=UPI002C6C585C
PDHTTAMVTNDTASNNGYYRWDSGTSSWVKRDEFYATSLDPTDTSEAVTGKAVGDYDAEKLQDERDSKQVKDSNVYELIDILGNVIHRIDGRGNPFFPVLGGGLKQVLEQFGQNEIISDDLLLVVTKLGRVVMRVDKSGEYHFPNQGRTVQRSIKTAIGQYPDVLEVYNELNLETTGVIGDGVWTWFNDPRAVYNNNNGKTYIGAIDENRNILVHDFDNSAEVVDGSYTIDTISETDDHDNPSFCILPSGKILAAYSEHVGPIYLSRSTNANDVSAWDTRIQSYSDVNYSYSQLRRLSREGKVYWFFRYERSGTSKRVRAFRTSSDGGDTWTSRQDLFEGPENRSYCKINSNGTDRIDFVFTDGHPNSTLNNLYHFYYQGGNYYKTDGTLIGGSAALPLSPSDVTKVWDATKNGLIANAWPWDLKYDSNGNPMVAFQTSWSDYTSNVAEDIYYYIAKWDGSQWNTEKICNGGLSIIDDTGEKQYGGGIAIFNENRLYVGTTEDDDTTRRIYRAYKVDGEWGLFDLPANEDNVKNARPYCLDNYNAPIRVLFWEGSYHIFLNYNTNIKFTNR